jgi:transcriptional regulator with XRE-family HTH domain
MKFSVLERIRNLRVTRGLSQENIANELDLSKGAYSNIERGASELSVNRLIEIADIFNVHPSYFFENGQWDVSEKASPKTYNIDINEINSEVQKLKIDYARLQAAMQNSKTSPKKKSRK